MNTKSNSEVRLPAGLRRDGRELDPERRRSLAKLTKDGLARVVYGIHDSAQQIPHVAVILHGRRLVAWVLATSWERDSDVAGELVGERWESILPAVPELQRDFGSEGFRSQLVTFVRRKTILHEREGIGRHTELFARSTREYTESCCEDLTRLLGMVQILVADYSWASDSKRAWRTVGALLPAEKGRHWVCENEMVAKSRASWELRTPPFWKLATSTHVHCVDAAGPRLTVEALGNFLRQNSDEVGAGILEGAVAITGRITHHALGEIAIEAKRSYKDMSWHMSLERVDPAPGVGRILAHGFFPEIFSGASALRIAEIALLKGAFPAAEQVPSEAPAALDPFKAAVDRFHERARQLQFVCDAYGLAPSPAPQPNPTAV